MHRLSANTTDQLPATVEHFGYDRTRLRHGILHLGVGAFHRAHQAVYTDTAIALSGGDWGIVGASLRSDSVARQLNPQDGLYTVRSEDANGQQLRLIGALQQVLVASQERDRLNALMADPAMRVITLTVTEKGYCLGADGWSLDSEHPDIQRDLDNPAAAVSAIGVLAHGLHLRYCHSAAPLTVISCDNLSENSARLAAALRDYLQLSYPECLSWLTEAVTFPCSMVDRIVPAPGAGVLEEQARLLGLRDEAAVVTEGFSQWIIENRFATDVPDWAGAGALLVGDIRPYESLKLGLLNASHSAIAYLGLLLDKTSVADVVADPPLRDYLQRLMARDLIPALRAPAGFDLPDYADQLLQRFANPGLHHRCSQIAMDATEKIRQRWLPALEARSGDLLLRALAAWCSVVLHSDLEIDDPRRDTLLAIRASTDGDTTRLTRLLGTLGIAVSEAPLWRERLPVLQRYCADIRAGKLRELLAT
ncbi:mannitol dehydrogenase family protein [Parahaliea aestuarii]|uniref:Mannitol dehydrogenase family protein n=1 Tax=Parahaliea aestuarii TaxID=1852021 RepID=A0A5C8ZS47_9GAMM|nr:mannitol dehydrogenase family protein [Parahaliea aestuarii]TXS90559.1 mannitol dehydrogenase family protein [Parahaliea aestuarii]